MRRRRRIDRRPIAVGLLGGLAVASLVVGQEGDTRTPTTPAAVSTFVYADAVDTIRFSHNRHADVACSDCHTAATTSRRAADDLRPAMIACASCHAAEASPQLNDCAGCHVGFSANVDTEVKTPEQWRNVRPAPMRVPAGRNELRFSHAAHVGAATCTGCHGAATTHEPSFPSEASCRTCHDGGATSPPATCTTCHPTDAKTGRISTRRDGIDAKLRPDNHAVDWMKRHPAVARADGDDCMSCHTENDCASCHSETSATPFAVHPPNFLAVHAVDARLNAGNCTDCHSTQTFCTTCHVRADVTTRASASPPPRRMFHPPGWLDSSLPNSHGFAARRDIVECATCHAEADCISCHAGVNPHPPEFAIECATMLSANPVACSKCHADTAALSRLCR